ncbi:MAG: two-component regulator propeller domain-containing protein [Flavobacteriales bacterium]
MIRIYSSLFVVFLVFTSMACVEKKSTENEVDKTEFTSTRKSNQFDFTSGVHSMLQDSKGNYWFGNRQEGLCRYNGKEYEYFTASDGLLDNFVFTIQEDVNGTVWVQTSLGINGIANGQIKKHTFESAHSGWNRKNENSSASTWEKTSNDLWFSADVLKGVYRFDGQHLSYIAFPSLETNDPLTYAVSCIAYGNNNNVWIGAYSHVFGFDGSQLTIINDQKLGYSKELDLIHVRSILEDSKGRLWLGNNGIGVLLKEDSTFINFSKQQGHFIPSEEFHQNTLSKHFEKNTGLQSVFAIQEDHEGNIWFGDRDSGTWKYDGKQLTNYKIDTTLKSQMIKFIYRDNGNKLWFGMDGGEVYQLLDGSFKKWN